MAYKTSPYLKKGKKVHVWNIFMNFLVPSFQNLLASHDIVAQRDYLPKLKDVPLEVDEDEETVKLVQLVKSQEPLVSF